MTAGSGARGVEVRRVTDGVVPENLANCVLTNDDFGPDSLQYMTLTQAGQALWQNGYSDFLAGGS